MIDTSKSNRRKSDTYRNGVPETVAEYLFLPLLLAMILTSDGAIILNSSVEAFVAPCSLRNSMAQSFAAPQNGRFPASLGCLTSRPTGKKSGIVSRLFSTHFQEQQEEQTADNKGKEVNYVGLNFESIKNTGEKDEAKRLFLNAERLRLEAEQLDVNLTLQKIAVLEEKLSNDAWLKKQQEQTVKDHYEDLRRLEDKISRPVSTVRNMDERIPTTSKEVWSTSESSPAKRLFDKPNFSNSDDRNSRAPKNPNLPPISGFDENDLKMYVPVAEDVTKMSPNATLDERIGLFRDAPQLQAHFKEKIQNLLLGPLEEMQELEELKEEYLASTSSKEKDALLKKIKQLEVKMDENTIGMSANGFFPTEASSKSTGISYSNSILLPPETLPSLTETELEERLQAIKALPDILVAVYLQRNGLYNLPVAFSTINLEVETGGIDVNMNIVNISANNTNDKNSEENNTETSGVGVGNEVSFDLYENLKLAIQLDYYDLQLQLLNQALGIHPMPEEVRLEYSEAFRSLPAPVRARYVTENLGIDTLETAILVSENKQDIERVAEEIITCFNKESCSPFNLSLNGESNKRSEKPIVPLEYNDVEFIDRSRYLEEFMPSVALLEDHRPSPEEIDLFVADCLTVSGRKLFMVTSKPERVIGGYYVRGTNQLRFDENNSTSANDRLVQEVYQHLENHPTLKDKIEFFYILDPSPPSDEDVELEVGVNPLFLVTAHNPQVMYGISSPLTKTAVSISGLVFTFMFSLGSCVLNPKINANLQNSLDILTTNPASAHVDLQWFSDLCLPLYFSFLGILFAHEMGHRLVATYYKFDIGLPNVLPSLTTGIAGSITPIRSPPPNNKALFDFAMAGPLAGLAVSLGLLFVGLELTRDMGLDSALPIMPIDLARSSSLGGGMIQYFLGKYTLLPDQGSDAYISLQPFALSGWIGCTINALALLPLGHTDGGRISLSMFGRRGAFVNKLFTTLILVMFGLFGLDDMNVLLAYVVSILVWQRELESPIRNEVDELDFSRGLFGIMVAILVGLILIPMTS